MMGRSCLYLDARIGGVPKLVLGDPSELMRLPDGFLKMVGFLCVDRGGGDFRMGGTAFFLSIPGFNDFYLVTARHCVELSREYEGGLYLRLNKHEGGYGYIQLKSTWYFAESEADDVAVTTLPITAALDFDLLPHSISTWCVTDEVVAGMGIGIGDELLAIGLFTNRDGRRRNRPILRSGIISAMPDEPLEDLDKKLEYRAYLAEIRSIGGLSGSPVYVVFSPWRIEVGTYEAAQQRGIFLLGFVRGHYPKRSEELADFGDFGESEASQLNTGIAIVTPIQRALEIIMNTEELVKDREAASRRRAELDAPVEDSAFPDNRGEFSRFEDLTRKLVHTPKHEPSKGADQG